MPWLLHVSSALRSVRESAFHHFTRLIRANAVIGIRVMNSEARLFLSAISSCRKINTKVGKPDPLMSVPKIVCKIVVWEVLLAFHVRCVVFIHTEFGVQSR